MPVYRLIFAIVCLSISPCKAAEDSQPSRSTGHVTESDVKHDLCDGVHFTDPETGWAVGEGGTILATRDGGATWTPQDQRHRPRPSEAYILPSAETGWTSAGAARSSPPATAAPPGHPKTAERSIPSSSVHFTSSRDRLGVGKAARSSPPAMAAHLDTAKKQHQQNLEASILPTAETGWAVGSGGTILASDDGGAKWKRKTAAQNRR